MLKSGTQAQPAEKQSLETEPLIGMYLAPVIIYKTHLTMSPLTIFYP
jgi:hypothetical protein